MQRDTRKGTNQFSEFTSDRSRTIPVKNINIYNNAPIYLSIENFIASQQELR